MRLDEDKPPFTKPVQSMGVGLFSNLKQLIDKEVAVGKVGYVEPSSCVVWRGNSRDHTSLTESGCAKLISDIKAINKQLTPAVVRKTDEEGFKYEVVSGAKRLWAVNWIRSNCVGYSSLQYLIEVRELTDEEAFLVNDKENQSLEGISHYERAVSYCQAREKYYSSQKQMALALNIKESTLSRYLDMARLPEEILGALKDTSELRSGHAKEIKRIIRNELKKDEVTSKLEVLKEHKSSKSVKETIEFLSCSTEGEQAHMNKLDTQAELILAVNNSCSNRVDISKSNNVLTMKLTLVDGKLKHDDIDSALDVLIACE